MLPIADLGHSCWEQQGGLKIVRKMEVVLASLGCKVLASPGCMVVALASLGYTWAGLDTTLAAAMEVEQGRQAAASLLTSHLY